MKRVIIKYPYLVLLLAFFATSCSRESDVFEPGQEFADQVTFTIKVPGSSTAATRTISENGADDNRIEEIDILMFDSADKFVGSVYSQNIVDDQMQSNVKVARARLPQGDYRIVVLANVHSRVVARNIEVGTPIATAVYGMMTQPTPYGEKWNSTPGSNGYKPFVMWGEASSRVTIPQAGDEKIAITLVRMLAKVNVSVAYNGTQGSEDFVLRSVEVFNYNSIGRIAPTAARWAASPKKASAVMSYEESDYPTSLMYDNSGDVQYIKNDVAGKRFYVRDDIFINEVMAENYQGVEWFENVCLVIGGEYKGRMGYYRLDFADGANHIDVVRNHKYNFDISAIKNQGYSDANTALKNQPENMEYTVLPWDEGEIGEILVDGATQLIVSPSSELTFSKSVETQIVNIYTNYAKGWQVQQLPADAAKLWIVDGNGNYINWISVDNSGTSSAGAKDLKITVADNLTGASRAAFVHIKAGVIEHYFRVNQGSTPLISLKVSDSDTQAEISEIVFPSGTATTSAIVARNIGLDWAPYASTNLYYTRSILPAAITDITVSSTPAFPASPAGSLTLGSRSFTSLKPVAFTPAEVAANAFYEKGAVYTYSVSNGVQTMIKNLTIRQVHYNATAPLEDGYFLDGGIKMINIKSNAAWKITLKSDTKSALVSYDQVADDYNLPGGKDFLFSLKNDIYSQAIVNADIVFTISSTDPNRYFAPLDITIKAYSGVVQGLANSYFLPTASPAPILIPVIRANGILQPASGKLSDATTQDPLWATQVGLGYQVLDGDSNLTAAIIWSDTNVELTASGIIKNIKVVGTGTKAFVMVTPGNATGNVVIGLYKGGVLIWSWHIWGTTYYPYDRSYIASGPQVLGSGKGNYWMDRNLGATSNDITQPTSYGLYYQWARKDPFQRQASLHGVDKKPQYNQAGATIANPAIIQGTATDAAKQTILKPMALGNPWNGTTNNINGGMAVMEQLWGGQTGGKKTIFDPCPVGYRISTRLGDPEKNWGTTGAAASNTGNGMSTPFTNGNGLRWDDKGGNYPLTGYQLVSGAIAYDGYGYSYSSTLSGIGASYTLDFTLGATNPSRTSATTSAGQVRCVAE